LTAFSHLQNVSEQSVSEKSAQMSGHESKKCDENAMKMADRGAELSKLERP
jgi:hypothetical protein